MKNNKLILIILAGIAVGFFAIGATYYVYANPGYYAPVKKLASATTSLESMTPGTATTTLTYDTWQDPNNTLIIQNETQNTLSLAVQFSASSTALSVLNWHFEYSDDNKDWYPTSLFNFASTTPALSFSRYDEYQWITASSTCQAVDNACRSNRIVNVPTLSRYVRVLFSMKGSPTSHNNGGVWAEFIPQKQLSR